MPQGFCHCIQMRWNIAYMHFVCVMHRLEQSRSKNCNLNWRYIILKWYYLLVQVETLINVNKLLRMREILFRLFSTQVHLLHKIQVESLLFSHYLYLFLWLRIFSTCPFLWVSLIIVWTLFKIIHFHPTLSL